MANKALIERIRTYLQGDEERFNDFTIISSRFRSGDTDADLYLHHIRGFGLLHIVPELARLCPDAQKKINLLHALKRIKGDNHSEKKNDLLNATQRVKANNHTEKRDSDVLQRIKDNNNEMESESISKVEGSQNGKQKSGKKKSVAESSDKRMKKIVTNEMGSLQLNVNGRYGDFREEQELEVLSKDGYREQTAATGSSISSKSATQNGTSIQQNKGSKVLVKAMKSSTRLEGSSV